MRYTAWALIGSLMMTGCASPTVHYSHERSLPLEQNIQELGRTEAERTALREFASAHPDLADRPLLEEYLHAARAGDRRRRALAIQFRHQYPNLTPAEASVLIDDQMAREAEALFSVPPSTWPSPSQGIECTSLQFNNMTHTSCN